MSVSFGKTETWTSGWRGKQSTTEIRLNGDPVGEIRGQESAYLAGDMSYSIEAGSGRGQADSLKDAKQMAKRLLEPPVNDYDLRVAVSNAADELLDAAASEVGEITIRIRGLLDELDAMRRK